MNAVFSLRLILKLFIGFLLVSTVFAKANAATVSVSFNRGIVGEYGATPSHAPTDIKTFKSLGIEQAFLSQVTADDQFFAPQGNDAPMEITFKFTDGREATFNATLNWRNTSNEGFHGFGFVVDPREAVAGSGRDDGVDYTPSSPTQYITYMLQPDYSAQSFVDQVEKQAGGNAANSQTLTELNNYLAMTAIGTATISADPSEIIANGISESNITVQLKDANGNPLVTGGDEVVLTTDKGTLIGAETNRDGSVIANDNLDGTYSAVLTSSTIAEIATITGTRNGELIATNAQVIFTEVTVAPNVAPVAQVATYSTNEDVTLSVTEADGLANYVTDGDANETFTYHLVNGSGGKVTTLTDSNGNIISLTVATGDISFTPTANFNGEVTFPYIANDGDADSNQSTIKIIVNSVNDVPSITNATGSVTEDAAPTLTTSGSISISGGDTGEDQFQAETLTGIYGALNIAANGSWSYSADNAQADIQALTLGQSLTDVFTVTSTDGVTTGTITITINGVNDAPSITNATGSVTEDAAPTLTTSGSISISGGDTGEDQFQAETLTGIYGALNIAANGSWSYSADNAQADIQALTSGQSLTDEFTVTSTDGVTTGTITITINGVDDAPSITNATGSVTEDAAATLTTSGSISISGGDTGEDQFQAETLTGIYGTLNIAANGSWSYSADNAQADIQALTSGQSLTDEFTVTSTDGVTTGTITITINGVDDAPSITNATGSVTEDAAATLTTSGSISISGGDTGEDQFQAETLTGIYGTLNIAANGSWSYSADNAQADIQALTLGQSLTDVFTVTSTDGVTTGTITITINGVDDAPSITNATGSVTEDAAPTLTTSGSISISGGDTGEDQFQAETLTGIYGALNIAANGSWSYSADNAQADIQPLTSGQSLTDVFTVTSTDGVTTGTITITINGVNDAPSITNATGSVTEDAAPTLTTSGSISISGGDTGEDQFQAETLTGIYGALNIAANGSWSYSADNAQADIQALTSGQSLTDVFTVTSTDGVTTGTITITINGVDDAPSITNATGSVTEDAAATLTTSGSISISGGDTGEDQFQAETLTGIYGTLNIAANGSWSYSADNAQADIQALTSGQSLTDEFTVTSTDGVTTGTITITINGVDDAPIAYNQTVKATEETSVAITLTATDADESDVLTYSVVTKPVNGALDVKGAEVTYTPNADFVGKDTFTFKANDGAEDSNVATITIDVSNINDAPVADDKTITDAKENSAYDITLTGRDIEDGTNVTFEIVTQPANGKVVLEGDVATYTPNKGYSGPDSFTYKAKDAQGLLSKVEATVSINVNDIVPSPDKSTIKVSEETITADGQSTSIVTVQLVDANGNNFSSGGDTVTLVTDKGTLSNVNDNGDGTYTATLTSSTNAGTATITATVNGSVMTSNPEVIFVVGAASADKSTIKVSEETITADGQSTSIVTIQLVDANGNKLSSGGDTVTLVTDKGTLSNVIDNGDGTYTATLTSSKEAGKASITATINGAEKADKAEVTFEVGAASAEKSTIKVSEETITADGQSTSIIIVQLVDANGNKLSSGGDTVTLVTDKGTLSNVIDNGDGTYTATLTSSTEAGKASITATINGAEKADKAEVTFEVGAASADKSTIKVSEETITADGKSTSTVTVQLIDANGNKLTSGGDTVILATDKGWLSDVKDNGDGTYTATLTSSVEAGKATITATINAVVMIEKPVVNFVAGAAVADKSTISVSKEKITADGKSTSTVTVQLVDANGNKLTAGGDTVTLVTDKGTLSDVKDNGDGTYTATLTSATEAGKATITATVNTVEMSNKPEVIFEVGAASAQTSTITVSETEIDADGTSTSVITVQLVDEHGNKLTAGGDTVTLVTDRGTITEVIDNGDGTYTAILTSATEAGTATITATVNEDVMANKAVVKFIELPNNAPEANAQNLETLEDGALEIILTASDIDEGDALTYSVVAQPENGTLTGSGESLTYTPEADFTGKDSFTFKANDGEDDSNVATITIEVTPVNDAPVAMDDYIEVLQRSVDNDIDVLANDSDVDGDELSVLSANAENGTVAVLDDGQLRYTPNASFFGEDIITYELTDGHEDGIDIGFVYVTVIEVENLPPVAVKDEFTLTSNASIVLDVLANDSDPENDELVLVAASTANGTAEIVDGELWFTPAEEHSGVYILEYSIRDSENNTAKAEVEVYLESGNGPFITIPADLCGENMVNSDALYTRVDLGVATAVDRFGNELPVSLIDGTALYPAGVNKAYWQATDSEGNTSTEIQRVCIMPLVSIQKDQTLLEGESATVSVHLNGPSPVYPLVIGYTVAGEASDEDHNLVNGQVVFTEGTTAYIPIETFINEAVNDNRNVVISLSDEANLGAKYVHTLTISDGNIAPEVGITVEQQGDKRLTVSQSGGIVTLYSNLYDPNTVDMHDYTWTSASDLLVNLSAADTEYQFDPVDLPVGVYEVALEVADNGSPSLADIETVYIEVVAELESFDDLSKDSDGDLIPDYLEGYQDSDGDGTPDYLDRIAECNVLQEEADVHNAYLIEGQPGVCLRKGKFTFGGEAGGALITDNDFVANDYVELEEDTEAINIGGTFDYIAYGLPEQGMQFAIAIPQRKPVPKDAVYRKYREDLGWGFFIEDGNNSLWSSKGEPGYCPPPNAKPDGTVWTPGLTEGHWCVQQIIEDGGVNDDDDISNGIIVDPGGVSIMINNNALPEASDDQLTMSMNSQATIDVIANDTDADGDALYITTIDASIGEVQLVDNQVVYTSPHNLVGFVTVYYGITDDNGGTDLAQIDIEIVDNRAPELLSEPESDVEGSESVETNLLDDVIDPEGDDVRLIEVDHPNVSFAEDGTVVFTPEEGFSGEVVINYVVVDEYGNRTEGQWTIHVVAINKVESVTSGGGSLFWLLLLNVVALSARLTMQLKRKG
ncbi:invasin domain 3-containing protein [Thalassotalea maritima]|uniref:invasin domain 3-containing protein n=1 Tax=Thalassotalea maritima TaxID=3242416 RepID=UPI0035274D93